MPLIVDLRVEGGQVCPWVDGTPLASPTPLAELPLAPGDSRHPLLTNPYTAGAPLFHALGGDALLARLEQTADGALLVQVDPEAEGVPWEFAAIPQTRDLLVARYGFARLIDKTAPPGRDRGPLHLIVLAADPLVDDQGQPREQRLGFDEEMTGLRRTLEGVQRQIIARRIPPTPTRLRQALRRGPAILHITAHGNVIDTDHGPEAVLQLEDDIGAPKTLLGRDLTRMAPRGVLRLAVLSACHTAQGTESHLARALVFNGVPAAVGMQGPFPDDLSDDLVEELYGAVADGLDLLEAMRMTRQRLLEERPGAAGLPVLYVAREGWLPLDIPAGSPDLKALRPPGRLTLPQEVQPERLVGRLRELHDLAHLFSQNHAVVTITGTGGVGKTTLAAAFARRFAWRWPQGVAGVSFASREVGELNFEEFLHDLAAATLGPDAAQRLTALPPSQRVDALLQELDAWDGLLLLDNYESVLQSLEDGDAPDHDEAQAIHRLVAQLAERGMRLLLTSRQQPAGLRNEQTYPPKQGLPGLAVEEGARLFFQHSPRAKTDPRAYADLARQVAQVTEGHPLAIALLAGEFDDSREVTAEEFLAHWPQELQAARRAGLAAHHATFAVAFDRSYARLQPAMQERLRLLSAFPFPFFAEAAAFMWGLADDQGRADITQARALLNRLVQRNLLMVDATFSESDQPATYRFQPVVLEALRARLTDEDRNHQQVGLAAYGAWLIDRAYGSITGDPALARLARVSMPAMDAAIPALDGVERMWRSWRLAWIKRSFGDFDGALALLQPYRDTLAVFKGDDEARRAASRIAHEMAYIYTVRGDLDEAMRLYQESLSIKESLGDLKGKSATLHAMAYIYRVRGDLDEAMRLYQEALTIDESLGDLKGKSATLHAMAYIYTVRGDLDEAMRLYQEALTILESLGDLQGKSATLHEMAYIYRVRGDLDEAMRLYQEALTILESLGDLQGMAATLTMQAQLLAVQGRRADALRQLQQALDIFQRLGMPRETAQVQEIIRQIEAAPSPAPEQDALSALLAQAHTLAQTGRMDEAIPLQEQAVSLARAAGDDREALVRLSVLLYNLAGYYAQAGRLDDAVAAMEEVVALDERTGHPDLESDRQTLAQYRKLAALSPQEREALQSAADAAQAIDLENLPPELQAQLQAIARQLQELGPQGLLVAQARDGAVAALRGEASREALSAQLQEIAAQIRANEPPDSDWGEVARFLDAVIALLADQPPPPVPARYAEDLAVVAQAKGD